MKILSLLRKFKKSFSTYQPLIEVLVFRKNILHNLHEFQKNCPGQKIAPVLKSNAYGHGLLPVAKILDKRNIAFLTVDSIFEAMMLCREGIKAKILVIGYTRVGDIKKNRYENVSFTLTNFGQLSEVAKKLGTKQSFHLKIDTGMHRQGILQSEIEKGISRIKSNQKIILEGVCSHFSSADSTDKKYSEFQLENWNDVVGKFKKAFPSIKYFHIAATAGSYYCGNKALPHSERAGILPQNTNVIRLGLGLYGMDPSPNRSLNLKPALELKTIITGIKKVQKGEFVGYGLTFKADQKITVATAPAGYFEGVDRRLSNCGYYKIGKNFCPIVGRVSMNMSVIDVSGATGHCSIVKVGDPVTLISSNQNDLNSVWQIAKLCDTIPYEILVHIPQHLRRRVV